MRYRLHQIEDVIGCNMKIFAFLSLFFLALPVTVNAQKELHFRRADFGCGICDGSGQSKCAFFHVGT